MIKHMKVFLSVMKIAQRHIVFFNDGESEAVVNPSEAFSHLIDYEIQLEDETTSGLKLCVTSTCGY
jgi:hypothetical protein